MIEIKVFDNIRKLRNLFKDAHPDAIQQIDTWESRLQELSNLEDFTNLKTTQEIAKRLRARLKSIIVKRMVESETPEEKNLKYLLGLLSPNIRSEIEQLNQEIEQNLTE